nr:MULTISPECIES: ATP-binding protein [unclassified Blautia]
MQTYLCRYTREFQERLTYQTYCKNQVTDAILHYYEEICREKRISFQCQVEAPENTGIEDTDFCRLFGNLLENAVEAAERCPDGSPRFIRVQIRARNNKLLIEEENSCTGSLRRGRDGIFSGKHSGQGIGTASISEIAARYGGLADFQDHNGIFKAEIFLRLTKKDTEDKLFG